MKKEPAKFCHYLLTFMLFQTHMFLLFQWNTKDEFLRIFTQQLNSSINNDMWIKISWTQEMNQSNE